MSPAKPNQLSRTVAKFQGLPAFMRTWVTSFALGKVVPLVGTAGLRFDEIGSGRVVVTMRNHRKVQNHIKGIHAAGMALLAETATGFCVGMNLPDDKLPLIKTLKVDYLKRAQGDMKAVAQLRPEQHQQRRLALLVGAVHVGVALEQCVEQAPCAQAVLALEAELGRGMQRGAAVGVHRVHVGPGVEQAFDDLRVAHRGGDRQGGALAGQALVDRDGAFEQQRDQRLATRGDRPTPGPGAKLGSRSTLGRSWLRSRYWPFSLLVSSTARNAFCGMSTEPIDFIRFLPSFCLAHSLRFREMSPP